MERSPTRPALPHVVVVGGGFGGVAAAKGLKHVPVRVTLVDKTNYHLFQPLLYQVATGILEPGTITTPIRAMFRDQKNVDVRMAEVTGDRQGPSPRAAGRWRGDAHLRLPGPGDRRARQLLRPRRVGAAGAEHEDAGGRRVSAAADHRRPRTGRPGRRPGGSRAAADVRAGRCGADRLRAGRRAGRALPSGADRVPPHRSAPGAHHPGRSRAARAGHVFGGSCARAPSANSSRSAWTCDSGKAVEMVDADGVVIAGERVPTRTVLWTAGVAASPAGRWLGVETDRAGRVVVGPDLAVAGYPEIFVVGDTAHIENNGKRPAGRRPGGAPEWQTRRALHPRARAAPAATAAVQLLRQRQHGHDLRHLRDHGKGPNEGWAD